MNKLGITTLRFTNREVFINLDGVIERILAVLKPKLKAYRAEKDRRWEREQLIWSKSRRSALEDWLAIAKR